MNIKSEKGVTLVDITVSIILITMFVTIVTILFYSTKQSKTEIERKKEATSIAIETIEDLKITKFEELKSQSKYYKDQNNKETPYYQEIIVTDYADLPENEGQNKIRNLVKKVTVKISFKVGAKTQDIEISIVRKKEN